MKIMIIQGSPRSKAGSPGEQGKTSILADEAMASLPPDVEVDFCDLGISDDISIIQPCTGCVSTAGGFHCRFPCDCYSKDDKVKPDFMHDEDIYNRLSKCDGFVVFTPIHWHSVSTVVKSFFDRMVCINMTMKAEKAIEMNLGKDPQKTRVLEKSGEHKDLLSNHFEGKVAAFISQGDDGANDYKEFGGDKPLPDSFSYKVGSYDQINDPREALMPIVWQCRYSGIFVPDHLVVGIHWNKGIDYASANEELKGKTAAIDATKRLMTRMIEEIKSKSKPA